MKKTIELLIIFTITAILAYFINNTYHLSKQYEATYIQYSKTKTLNNNVEKKIGTLLNTFVSLLTNIKQLNITQKTVNYEDELKQIKEKIQTNSIYILSLLIISFLLYFIISKKIAISFLYIQSMIFLIYGLISPIFLMYVTQNFGSDIIILQFESNSILSSIEKLFNQNNYFVGGVILIFSIIFPILKTIISFMALFFKNINILSKLASLSSSLSKVSMSDIFVLSIFLVYLSPKSDGIIKTELQVGFLFFFIYVIISLFTALVNKKN